MTKMVVLCINSEGSPEFHTCELQVTDEQIENGEHYQLAKESAQNNGYSEPMVSFDDTDPAAKQLANIFFWL